MNLSQLNGVTPEQLHKFIMKSSIGFSAEARSIQYLGRQIQLHDGITVLSEQTVNTVGSQQLFERMIRLQPELEEQLPGLKSEAINMAARHLVAEFNAEAIEKSPTNEVLCAVFLECMRADVLDVLDTVIELSKTHALSGTEKLPIMLAAEKKRLFGIPMCFWRSAGIPLAIRLEEAKNQFQRLPAGHSLAEKAEKIEINEGLTGLVPGKPVKDSLLEIRQILESENNQLSRQLLSEVDHIEKKFIQRVKESGHLLINDNRNFINYTQRLLYLYAACSGFSPEANIAELTSYIRSVLYTTHAQNIWHIAKELAYLSKQPDSIDYCRYIGVVADVLTRPAVVVSQFEQCKQLSDINGFSLLEGQPLDTYLTILRANIENLTPAYSPILISAVNDLENKVAGILLPEGKPDIKAKVHRLLMIIAACKSSRQIMDTRVLGDFVSAIMEHGNIKNIPYLISGLARLVQSTPNIQQILGTPVIKGGKPLRLAPLQLLAFVPDIISEANVVELNNNLQNSSTGRRQLKDGKVFHQWLVTLEQALASDVMNKAMVLPMLKKLTQSLTYEKLGLLHTIFKIRANKNDSFNDFLNSMSFSCLKEGFPLLIAEQGAAALERENREDSQWLLKQRHYHILPVYLLSMTQYCKELENTEITDLIHEFIQTSANNTFIETRQSPLNNPHLQAVYREYHQFKAGWGANFSGFSEATRNRLLSLGETLALTEDPWDLFISGLEVKTCQSPEARPKDSIGLMSYVMDGRNAMIVKKNQKGTILSRSIIRMVLDEDDHPALYLEKSYPDKSNLLFIHAAREIAAKMKLPLYHRADAAKGKKVKLLEGRAPFDYFDSFMELKARQEVTFTLVQCDAKVM